MKRKNLSLKLAALLLACGGFGAVSGFANSVYAMDSSDGFNSSEEKKQNEIRTSLVKEKLDDDMNDNGEEQSEISESLVRANSVDDINNNHKKLSLGETLSEIPYGSEEEREEVSESSVQEKSDDNIKDNKEKQNEINANSVSSKLNDNEEEHNEISESSVRADSVDDINNNHKKLSLGETLSEIPYGSEEEREEVSESSVQEKSDDNIKDNKEKQNEINANSVSSKLNDNEEEQNEISESLVQKITRDDILKNYKQLSLEEGDLSKISDRYLGFFKEYVISEHIDKDATVAEYRDLNVFDFAKKFRLIYGDDYRAYLEKMVCKSRDKLIREWFGLSSSSDSDSDSETSPINSINNNVGDEPSGDMLPANINDASDKQIQKFIQFLAYKQNIGGLDDFVGYDFKEVAKRYYDEYAAKYNEYVKKNKTGVEPEKINSISTTKTKIKIPKPFVNIFQEEKKGFVMDSDFFNFYKKFSENGGIKNSNFEEVVFEYPRGEILSSVIECLHRSGYEVNYLDNKYDEFHFSRISGDEVRSLYNNPHFGEFMELLCKNCGLNDLLATIHQLVGFFEHYWNFIDIKLMGEKIEELQSFKVKSSCLEKIRELPKKLKEYTEKMQKEYDKFVKNKASYGEEYTTVRKVFRLAAMEQLKLVQSFFGRSNVARVPSLCDLYLVDKNRGLNKPSSDLQQFGYEISSLILNIYKNFGLYNEDYEADRDKIKDFMSKEVLIDNRNIEELLLTKDDGLDGKLFSNINEDKSKRSFVMEHIDILKYGSFDNMLEYIKRVIDEEYEGDASKLLKELECYESKTSFKYAIRDIVKMKKLKDLKKKKKLNKDK